MHYFIKLCLGLWITGYGAFSMQVWKNLWPHLHHPSSKITYTFSTYGVPTYDVMFKRVLGHNERIRISFINALVPDLKVKSAEQIDPYMRSVKKYDSLREILSTLDDDIIDSLNHSLGKHSYVYENSINIFSKDQITEKKIEEFLAGIAQNIDVIRDIMPRESYKGAMDCLCETNQGFVAVEMQVISQNYWDNRDLAYIANVYGHQLSKGEVWHDLKHIVGINLLGGGTHAKDHWKATDHPVRDYVFQDKHNANNRIKAMRLVQYNLNQHQKLIDKGSVSKEHAEWLTFFHKASEMTEEQVKRNIKTPEILEAFEVVKLSKLPAEVQQAYELEDTKYSRYSQLTAKQIAQGRKEGIKIGEKNKALEIAQAMLKRGMSAQDVADMSGLTLEDIQKLQKYAPNKD